MLLITASQVNTGPADVEAWEVTDQETGLWLGRIAKRGGQWVAARGKRPEGGYRVTTNYRIVSAGPRVAFDAEARFASPTEAAEAVEEAWTADGQHTIGADGLSRYQRDVLDFEEKYSFAQRANKDCAILELFGVTLTRYYQLLGQLIQTGPALAYSPVTVNRLRRIAAKRAAARGALLAG